MTTIKHKHITALIAASSLGTRTARAARTSVTAAEGEALARRAAGRGQDGSEGIQGSSRRAHL